MNSMATPEVFPVAVIGAGPVGVAAAAHLADRDQAFVLLEHSNGDSATPDNVRCPVDVLPLADVVCGS